MSHRTMLIDGDIYIFQAAMLSETAFDWDDDIWTLHADAGQAREMVEQYIARDLEATECTDFIFTLTDRDRDANFRKDVLPSYKENRKKTRKPILIPHLRDWIEDTYVCYEKPKLEGDDVLGILMTAPEIIKGEKVCVSIDKDMKTIPGLHYNAGRPEDGVYRVTQEEADRFHLQQSLAGDAVDGYSGCPGIGMGTADKILGMPPHTMEPYRHTFARGPRKGQVERRWKEEFNSDILPWDTIVSYYNKAGLGMDEALRQARCARILRYTDYDFETQKVKLWEPS